MPDATRPPAPDGAPDPLTESLARLREVDAYAADRLEAYGWIRLARARGDATDVDVAAIVALLAVTDLVHGR